MQLREKQKLRRIYGVLERQFKNYYKEAARLEVLREKLEAIRTERTHLNRQIGVPTRVAGGVVCKRGAGAVDHGEVEEVPGQRGSVVRFCPVVGWVGILESGFRVEHRHERVFAAQAGGKGQVAEGKRG